MSELDYNGDASKNRNPPLQEVEALSFDRGSTVDKRGVGAKYDAGKIRWTLLPWRALEQVVAVMEFGAIKYAEGSWSKVPDGRRRYFDAAFRHLIASQSETNDPETKLPHLAHAACDVLFTLALTEQK
jgi:heat shock protein HspQ